MKQRNPMILVPLFAAASALVYMMLVKPCAEQLEKDRASLAGLRGQVNKQAIEISSKVGIQERTVEVERRLAQLGEQQIEPLLESYAMRAKAIVGPLAAQAGLVDAEFSDRPPLALPVLPGSAVPPGLHSRLPVVISCLGDYPAIVSFILRVERDLPYVALGALRIVPGGASEELQRAEITLEWPMKGAGK